MRFRVFYVYFLSEVGLRCLECALRIRTVHSMFAVTRCTAMQSVSVQGGRPTFKLQGFQCQVRLNPSSC